MVTKWPYAYTPPEALAPVNGGIRWRTPYHDVVERCRGKEGFVTYDIDKPYESEPEAESEPEDNGMILAPRFISTPPEEAREGEEYTYQARAFDGIADGCSWTLLEGPPGMSVDRYSGLVTWTPGEGGRFRVVLRARSVYGSSSEQSWTICTRKAHRDSAPVPNPRYRTALRIKSARRVVSIRPLRQWQLWSLCRSRSDYQPAAPPGGRCPAGLHLRL